MRCGSPCRILSGFPKCQLSLLLRKKRTLHLLPTTVTQPPCLTVQQIHRDTPPPKRTLRRSSLHLICLVRLGGQRGAQFVLISPLLGQPLYLLMAELAFFTHHSKEGQSWAGEGAHEDVCIYTAIYYFNRWLLAQMHLKYKSEQE